MDTTEVNHSFRTGDHVFLTHPDYATFTVEFGKAYRVAMVDGERIRVVNNLMRETTFAPHQLSLESPGVKYMQAIENKVPDDSALTVQIGGNHYKQYKIQPIEYCMANRLDACQSSVVKYITRFRNKGGIEDLKKAQHFINILIELENINSIKSTC